MTWKLTQTGVFDVRSYYILLAGPLAEVFQEVFPCQSIWCVKVLKTVPIKKKKKVLKTVFFFLWTTTRDKILTIDNLVKRG